MPYPLFSCRKDRQNNSTLQYIVPFIFQIFIFFNYQTPPFRLQNNDLRGQNNTIRTIKPMLYAGKRCRLRRLKYVVNEDKSMQNLVLR